MTLGEKILCLRQKRGMTQEDLAEALQVSRQAVSRWESGSAMPDAQHLLRIGDFFGISIDRLLREDLCDQSTSDCGPSPANNQVSLFIALITLEVMILIMECVTAFVLQRQVFTILCFVPFAAVLGGFEIGCRRCGAGKNDPSGIRRKFYILSVWLGLYFPVRFLIGSAAWLYPRPYSSLLLEGVILIVYLAVAILCTWWLRCKSRESSGT